MASVAAVAKREREGSTVQWSGQTDRILQRISNRHGTGSLGHRVSGSFGSSFTSRSPGHHFDPRDPSFSGFRKKVQDKDIKRYISVKIRPTVIEILAFNK